MMMSWRPAETVTSEKVRARPQCQRPQQNRSCPPTGRSASRPAGPTLTTTTHSSTRLGRPARPRLRHRGQPMPHMWRHHAPDRRPYCARFNSSLPRSSRTTRPAKIHRPPASLAPAGARYAARSRHRLNSTKPAPAHGLLRLQHLPSTPEIPSPDNKTSKNRPIISASTPSCQSPCKKVTIDTKFISM